MPEAAVLALMHKTAEKKKARKLAMDLDICFLGTMIIYTPFYLGIFYLNFTEISI